MFSIKIGAGGKRTKGSAFQTVSSLYKVKPEYTTIAICFCDSYVALLSLSIYTLKAGSRSMESFTKLLKFLLKLAPN